MSIFPDIAMSPPNHPESPSTRVSILLSAWSYRVCIQVPRFVENSDVDSTTHVSNMFRTATTGIVNNLAAIKIG